MNDESQYDDDDDEYENDGTYYVDNDAEIYKQIDERIINFVLHGDTNILHVAHRDPKNGIPDFRLRGTKEFQGEIGLENKINAQIRGRMYTLCPTMHSFQKKHS